MEIKDMLHPKQAAMLEHLLLDCIKKKIKINKSKKKKAKKMLKFQIQIKKKKYCQMKKVKMIKKMVKMKINNMIGSLLMKIVNPHFSIN